MANKSRGAVLATLIFMCAGCVVAPGAALAGTLDQQQTDGSSSPPYTLGSINSLAQTFTAGIRGGVDQVDLYLGDGGSGAAPLSVEIRDVSGGAPGSTVLASHSVPASSVPPGPGFVSINFATPASVVAGAQYAIVAYSAEASQYYGWSGSSTVNPYAGGAAFYSATSPPGAWTPITGMPDLAFKTYVVPSMTTTTAPTATPAGQRAAALKKCKKKNKKSHDKKKFRKCKKKANLLPL